MNRPFRFFLSVQALFIATLETVATANSAPVVSDVTAVQRNDGSKRVDLRYNLADADGDACTVMVLASDDGGATWAVPITAVTGAVGCGVTPGSGKHIFWNSETDLPGVFGSQYKVRVCADDGQGAEDECDGNCDDGEFCNGLETCVNGECVSGDGPCEEGDLCDEDNDVCQRPCTKAEQCDDGNLCTDDDCVDGFCKTAAVVCANDGEFCNGDETCDPTTGACVSSGSPCLSGESCDEVNDTCIVPCSTADNCDDCVFCNGQEQCLEGRCTFGPAPCTDPELCDENNDECIAPSADKSISGTVTDADGVPLEDVSVTALDGATEVGSTATDEDGNYVLAALPAGQYTVKFSAIGFNDVSVIDVTVSAGETTEDVDAVMTPEL